MLRRISDLGHLEGEPFHLDDPGNMPSVFFRERAARRSLRILRKPVVTRAEQWSNEGFDHALHIRFCSLANIAVGASLLLIRRGQVPVRCRFGWLGTGRRATGLVRGLRRPPHRNLHSLANNLCREPLTKTSADPGRANRPGTGPVAAKCPLAVQWAQLTLGHGRQPFRASPLWHDP